MKSYIKLANEKAYQLLNPGGLVIVSSASVSGSYNMAPIAWHSPVDYDPITRLLFVTDKEHLTYKNIEETRQFVICLLHKDQLQSAKDLGSCSGKKVDKLEKFAIKTFDANVVNCKVLDDCIGYIECKVYNIHSDGAVALVFGEVLSAMVDEKAYKSRLLTENEAGKIIHHISGKVFTTPSDTVIC